MPTVFLSPIFNAFNVATPGWLPNDSGKLYTYIAGTETPKATWTTVDGDVENANPIILGVDGRPPNEIWLESGVSYLFVLKDEDDNLIQSYDDITGVNDIASSTPTVSIEDEGVDQGDAHTLNFTGNGVTASVTAGEATITINQSATGITTGDIVASAARTRSNALLCDGSAVSRSTYSALFDVIVPSLGTFTVTIASPAVFSLNSHGLVAGDAVYFTTTGALPTGLSANTIYYVISAGLTSNAFEVSATRGGSAVNTSGTQSGTHTARFCPYGLGNGTTTFNVPNLSGRVLVGAGAGSGLTARPLGLTDGAESVTLSASESGTTAHTHTGSGTATGSPFVYTVVDDSHEVPVDAGLIFQQSNAPGVARQDNGITYGNQPLVDLSGFALSLTVDAASAAAAVSAHNNMQPFNVVNWFIVT